MTEIRGSGHPVATTRTAVIIAAWRAIDGLSALSASDGAPLSRAVKCIVEPLVIRPSAHPELASAVLDESAADALRRRIADAAPVLQHAAAWHPVLKARRRALGITQGNAQERCFPLAFELATVHGAPGPDAEAIADAALAEAHDGAADASALAAALSTALADASLETRLADEWQRTTAATRDWAEHERASTDALAASLATLGGDDAERTWLAVLALDRPLALLEGLRVAGGDAALARAIEQTLPGASATGAAGTTLGLTRDRVRVAPRARGRGVDDAVLERSLERRIHALARGDRVPRAAAAEAAGIVDDQMRRACAPAGLDDATGAAFALGLLLAPGLRPLSAAEHRDARLPEVLRVIRHRLAQERFVLRARRYVVGDAVVAPVADAALAHVVRELVEFHRPFVRRLWARLHGMDATHGVDGAPLDAAGVRDLLTGVARSTSLDLRTRIRRTLERQAAA